MANVFEFEHVAGRGGSHVFTMHTWRFVTSPCHVGARSIHPSCWPGKVRAPRRPRHHAPVRRYDPLTLVPWTP